MKHNTLLEEEHIQQKVDETCHIIKQIYNNALLDIQNLNLEESVQLATHEEYINLSDGALFKKMNLQLVTKYNKAISITQIATKQINSLIAAQSKEITAPFEKARNDEIRQVNEKYDKLVFELINGFNESIAHNKRTELKSSDTFIIELNMRLLSLKAGWKLAGKTRI